MKANSTMKMCREAFNQLVQEVESGNSDTLVEYLKTMGRFHRYSLFNQMLILSQKKDAQQVSGFWSWKKLGRSVVKGAKGIAIIAPIVYRKKTSTELEEEENDANDLESVRNYKVCHVFDVSDTHGRPLPEFSQVKGEPGIYLERLKSFIASKGIKLDTRHIYGTTQGYSVGGSIVLKSELSQAEYMSTLVHEFAHELIHRNSDANHLDRNAKEIEAEAISYIVCSGIGMDSNTAHADYLQLYQGDKTKLLKSLKRIQATASDILEAITQEEKLVVTAEAA